jgi:hypothetical protein
MQGTEDVFIGHAELCPVRLTLEEVRELGLPAYFLDYGEALLYWRGEIFEANTFTDPDRSGEAVPLPAVVLETGVGVEYGWRHLYPCACPHCGEHRSSRLQEAA